MYYLFISVQSVYLISISYLFSFFVLLHNKTIIHIPWFSGIFSSRRLLFPIGVGSDLLQNRQCLSTIFLIYFWRHLACIPPRPIPIHDIAERHDLSDSTHVDKEGSPRPAHWTGWLRPPLTSGAHVPDPVAPITPPTGNLPCSFRQVRQGKTGKSEPPCQKQHHIKNICPNHRNGRPVTVRYDQHAYTYMVTIYIVSSIFVRLQKRTLVPSLMIRGGNCGITITATVVPLPYSLSVLFCQAAWCTVNPTTSRNARNMKLLLTLRLALIAPL